MSNLKDKINLIQNGELLNAETLNRPVESLADEVDTKFSEFELTVQDSLSASSIDHVSKVSGTGAPGTTDTYEVWLDAGETVSAGTFTVYNGHNVDHVSKTSGTGAAGTTDTYTAWGDAAETQTLGTFVLYNGADGNGAINDTTVTTTTLWSSSKINSELSSAQQSAVAMAIVFGG